MCWGRYIHLDLIPEFASLFRAPAHAIHFCCSAFVRDEDHFFDKLIVVLQELSGKSEAVALLQAAAIILFDFDHVSTHGKWDVMLRVAEMIGHSKTARGKAGDVGALGMKLLGLDTEKIMSFADSIDLR